jgi:hypothetical protein
VTISQTAPASGTVVSLQSNSPALVLRTGSNPTSQNITVTVPSGQTSVGFEARSVAVNSDASATVSATPGAVSQTITVLAPKLSAVGVPNGAIINDITTMSGGTSRSMTVRLSSSAPSGGIAVLLSSNSTLLTLPSIVTVTGGQTTTDFTVTAATTTVDVDATITATFNGTSKTVLVRIPGPIAASAVSVAPTEIPAGGSSTGTITLNTVAPAGGTSVALVSNSNKVIVPGSVTVAAGQTSATFPITTTVFGATSNVSAQITATAGGASRVASLTVDPYNITSVTAPVSVTGGGSAQLSVRLNQVAPAGGLIVALSSSNTAFPVPPSLTIPAGLAVASVSVVPTPVATNVAVSLGASFEQAAATTQLTLLAPALSSFALNSTTVIGGGSVTGNIGLQGNAPAGGFVVTVTTNSPSVVTVPPTVTVAPATNGASLTVVTRAVTTPTVVTITVSAGTTSRSQTLTINP